MDNANDRLEKALEGQIIKERNSYSSRMFIECTFGPTKDGSVIKDLMA